MVIFFGAFATKRAYGFFPDESLGHASMVLNMLVVGVALERVLEIWRRFPFGEVWSIFRHLEGAVLWGQHQGGDGDRAGGAVLVLLAVLCHHPLELFILFSNGVCLLPIPILLIPHMTIISSLFLL